MADLLGQNGGKEITGTYAITPDAGHDEFFAIVNTGSTALTFSAATASTGVDCPDLTALTIASNATVLGRWTSITPSAGEGVAYYDE